MSMLSSLREDEWDYLGLQEQKDNAEEFTELLTAAYLEGKCPLSYLTQRKPN